MRCLTFSTVANDRLLEITGTALIPIAHIFATNKSISELNYSQWSFHCSGTFPKRRWLRKRMTAVAVSSHTKWNSVCRPDNNCVMLVKPGMSQATYYTWDVWRTYRTQCRAFTCRLTSWPSNTFLSGQSNLSFSFNSTPWTWVKLLGISANQLESSCRRLTFSALHFTDTRVFQSTILPEF